MNCSFNRAWSLRKHGGRNVSGYAVWLRVMNIKVLNCNNAGGKVEKYGKCAVGR